LHDDLIGREYRRKRNDAKKSKEELIKVISSLCDMELFGVAIGPTGHG
jgi:hypothetical protein